MNKRLISLMLAVLTLFSVLLTSCSSTSNEDAMNDVTDEASRYTTTLNMYVVTEKETTPEAAAKVNDAINKITKAKFKTQVNIYFNTLDNHYALLDEKFAKIEADIAAEEEAKKALKKAQREAKARGETLATTAPETTSDETTAEETILNEYGLSELKYPAESSRQVDIIFVNGYDRYLQYCDDGILERLDDELSSGSKKLKNYINPVFMDAAVVNGATYAIPNNHTIGEYTYLLVNKEMAAKYSYDLSEFVDLASVAEFVEDVAKHEPTITPVCGDIELTNIRYLSLDKETLEFIPDRSIVAAYVSPTAGYSSRLTFRNIFATRQITDQLKTIKLFEEKDLIKKNADPSKPFAVSIMKGGYELNDVYGEDYHMIVLENPMAYEDSLYAGMFGVTQYTKDLTRSMEIITYINTNPELRNLLQYGIENENYVINEDGTLTRLNKTYMMDLLKTGNAFVAYPEEGMPVNAWDYGKKQNIDARLDPMNGFEFDAEALNWDYMDIMNNTSKTYLAELADCKTYDDVVAFIDRAYEELTANTEFANSTKILVEGTPNFLYNEWHTMNWPPEG